MIGDGKHIAIITGAGSGIGLAIASKLAMDGAKVFLNDIDLQSLERVKVELQRAGVPSEHISFMSGDVASSSDVKDLFDACLDTFDRIWSSGYTQ